MRNRQTSRGCAKVGVCALGACVALLCLPAATSAQNAQQRQAAANAFDRGTTAYLQDDFATAARYFEMANDLAPASGALMQAIIAHRRADNELRAASLSLRLIAAFPGDADMVARAEAVLDDLADQFVRVDVTCDAECAVEIDGGLSGHDSFFVEPDGEHRIGATFDTGTEEQTVLGAAGETKAVSFEAPAAPEPEPAPPVTSVDPSPLPGPGTPAEPADSGGLSPAFFITSLVLTAGAGGLLVWSGLKTLSARDDFEDEPTQARYDDGQKLELRTNVLIGITAGLGALTVLFAILTDWGGSDDDDGEVAGVRLTPQLSLGPKDRSGGMVLEGTF